MRLMLLIFAIFNFTYAIEGVKNVHLNTMDFSEVQERVLDRLEKINLKNLGVNKDYKQHVANIKNLDLNIKAIVDIQKNIRDLKKELKLSEVKYALAEKKYTEKMDNIYSINNHIQRVTYYLVSHSLESEYLLELKNYLVDTYAIEKYDQSTEIKESSQGITSYKNVVNVNKYFGEMQVDTIKDFTFRDKNLNIKLLKVIQSPFVNSNDNLFTKSFNNEVDKFNHSANIKIVEVNGLGKIETMLLNNDSLADEDKNMIISTVKTNLDIKNINKKFNNSSLEIRNILKEIENIHDNYIEDLNKQSMEINKLTFILEKEVSEFNLKVSYVQNIAKYYSIKLNFNELEKMIIITPRLYSEYVDLDEEKEFVWRKISSYLSKISISELQQFETLTNYYDLKTENLNKQKMIEYESIHFFPFVDGKELSVLVFGIIELEDKVSESDYIRKNLKYSSLEFVPVKYGFKTIFTSTTEITLATVKEFLETHRLNKYFDQDCIDDSSLPSGVKDFTRINEEFYNYPAICFNLNRVDEFMDWLAVQVGKKIRFAHEDEWSYVASNSNSSEYCWGNETLEELNEDGLKPENIYYEDGKDTSILPVKKFEKSMLGIYDMCGNVHELVKTGEDYMIKGNSYISYIESSTTPALEYDENLKSAIGIRAFYVMEH